MKQRVIKVDDDNNVSLSQEKDAQGAITYYGNLIWPFIDSYWIASVVLFNLKPNGLGYHSVLQRMQWLCETLVNEGKLSCQESCSSDTLKTAVSALQAMKVIALENYGQNIKLTDK